MKGSESDARSRACIILSDRYSTWDSVNSEVIAIDPRTSVRQLSRVESLATVARHTIGAAIFSTSIAV